MGPPKDHPERKPNRLTNYDYSLAGAYFVTINAYQRESLFGEIVDGIMQLNDMGEIVVAAWELTPVIRPNVELDEFVMMPDHFHALLFIHEIGPAGVRATASLVFTSDRIY